MLRVIRVVELSFFALLCFSRAVDGVVCLVKGVSNTSQFVKKPLLVFLFWVVDEVAVYLPDLVMNMCVLYCCGSV